MPWIWEGEWIQDTTHHDKRQIINHLSLKTEEIVIVIERTNLKTNFSPTELHRAWPCDSPFYNIGGHKFIHRIVLRVYDEYIIFNVGNKLQQVVDNMNIPYGKSAVDKLYCLRVYGQIDDYDLAHVLTE